MEISFCSDSRRPPANIPLVENDAEASCDVNSDENDGYYRSDDQLINLSVSADTGLRASCLHQDNDDLDFRPALTFT